MAQSRPTARLTASGTGEFELARIHLRTLVTAAATLVTAADHDPDLAGCSPAGCRLAEVEAGPRLCALAHRLVLLDLEADAGTLTGTAGDKAVFDQARFDEAVTAFRLALVDSLDAVRACRSVGHAEGRCWFAPSAATDVCGEVLRVAHLAG